MKDTVGKGKERHRSKVQKLREEIEQVNAEIEKAQREYDLNKAAELQYGKLPELEAAAGRARRSRRRPCRQTSTCCGIG